MPFQRVPYAIEQLHTDRQEIRPRNRRVRCKQYAATRTLKASALPVKVARLIIPTRTDRRGPNGAARTAINGGKLPLLFWGVMPAKPLPLAGTAMHRNRPSRKPSENEAEEKQRPPSALPEMRLQQLSHHDREAYAYCYPAKNLKVTIRHSQGLSRARQVRNWAGAACPVFRPIPAGRVSGTMDARRGSERR